MGQSKPRQPITLDLLHRLRKIWLEQARGIDGLMLWAASSLCFFGFLRSGEVTVPTDTASDEAMRISFKDVAVDKLNEPTMVSNHYSSM